jgi:acetyl esterase/lipase
MLQTEPIYAAPGGISLRYDLFSPSTPGPHPLIVCIHGGGWISGQKEDFSEIAQLFASRGYAAATIQYRLAPLHPFPAAVEDVRNFVRYARDNAASLNIDPKRIAAMGSSAGAHLALMLGVASAPEERVQVVLDLCGLTDMTDFRTRHFDIAHSFIDQFLPDATDEIFRQASPVTLVSAQSAPTLIVHGEDDDIVPIAQSESFAAALLAHNVPYRFLRVPGEAHGFSMAAWPTVEKACFDFLGEHL